MTNDLPKIQPCILGSGMAGQAMGAAFGVMIAQQSMGKDESAYAIQPPVVLPRDIELGSIPKDDAQYLLCIATPHALHSDLIQQGVAAGFHGVFSEKPTSTNEQQLQAMQQLVHGQPNVPIAVGHVYRHLWGPQSIKQRIDAGDIGNLLAIEGKFLQHRRGPEFMTDAHKAHWQAAPALRGPHGVSLELGSHWLDMAAFLAGDVPLHIQSAAADYTHAYDAEDDTGFAINLVSETGVKVHGTFSTAMPGAGHGLRIQAIGTEGSLEWTFEQPDILMHGHGDSITTLRRNTPEPGTGYPPYHGIGWTAGYVDVLRQVMSQMVGLEHGRYPTLVESNETMQKLLQGLEFARQHERSHALNTCKFVSR